MAGSNCFNMDSRREARSVRRSRGPPSLLDLPDGVIAQVLDLLVQPVPDALHFKVEAYVQSIGLACTSVEALLLVQDEWLSKGITGTSIRLAAPASPPLASGCPNDDDLAQLFASLSSPVGPQFNDFLPAVQPSAMPSTLYRTGSFSDVVLDFGWYGPQEASMRGPSLLPPDLLYTEPYEELVPVGQLLQDGEDDWWTPEVTPAEHQVDGEVLRDEEAADRSFQRPMFNRPEFTALAKAMHAGEQAAGLVLHPTTQKGARQSCLILQGPLRLHMHAPSHRACQLHAIACACVFAMQPSHHSQHMSHAQGILPSLSPQGPCALHLAHTAPFTFRMAIAAPCNLQSIRHPHCKSRKPKQSGVSHGQTWTCWTTRSRCRLGDGFTRPGGRWTWCMRHA